MFRIVPYPGHPDWDRLKGIQSIAVDPEAEFDPGMIRQLAVIGGQVVGIKDTGEDDKPDKPEESE